MRLAQDRQALEKELERLKQRVAQLEKELSTERAERSFIETIPPVAPSPDLEQTLGRLAGVRKGALYRRHEIAQKPAQIAVIRVQRKPPAGPVNAALQPVADGGALAVAGGCRDQHQRSYPPGVEPVEHTFARHQVRRCCWAMQLGPQQRLGKHA